MKDWKHTIDFIGRYEKLYRNNVITLNEMCLKIMHSFYTYGWISEKPVGDEFQNVSKLGIESSELDELGDIVYGESHTIAFAKNIFDNEDEYPTVDDYDRWKEDLYEWCDHNRVWIKPRY